MKRVTIWFFSVVLLIFMALAVTPLRSYAAGNSCPIIIVHAWSQQAYNLYDIQNFLRGEGFEVYTPAMGPFSSTWDRACELYAQIKGGTVDYGLFHSMKYGHARYGRTYPGMYPEWGTADPATGKIRRAHFIGYCFGGAVVLAAARMGEPLDAVGVFHGMLSTDHPAAPGAVKARILVATGADDPMIPKEAVDAFRKEMDAAGAKYEVIVYPGAKHSFTNPEAGTHGMEGLAYNAEADQKSWEALRQTLHEAFGR